MAEYTDEDKQKLNIACDFILEIRPIIKSIERHDQEIRAMQLNEVKQDSEINGVVIDTNRAHERISKIQKDDLENLKSGGKSWENAFWKVFAIVVVFVTMFLKGN